jgi:hypothetical protein
MEELDLTRIELLVKILDVSDEFLADIRSKNSEKVLEEVLYDLFLDVEEYIKNGTIIAYNYSDKKRYIDALYKLKN